MTARNSLLHSTEQVGSFRFFVKAFEESLDALEKEIRSTDSCKHCCADQGCLSIEHHIDKLHNELFSMSEPRESFSAEDSAKIKELKYRLHKLYEDMGRSVH